MLVSVQLYELSYFLLITQLIYMNCIKLLLSQRLFFSQFKNKFWDTPPLYSSRVNLKTAFAIAMPTGIPYSANIRQFDSTQMSGGKLNAIISQIVG